MSELSKLWEFQWNPRNGSSLHCFQVELEFKNDGFCGRRKTRVPGEQPLEQGREPTTNYRRVRVLFCFFLFFCFFCFCFFFVRRPLPPQAARLIMKKPFWENLSKKFKWADPVISASVFFDRNWRWWHETRFLLSCCFVRTKNLTLRLLSLCYCE